MRRKVEFSKQTRGWLAATLFIAAAMRAAAQPGNVPAPSIQPERRIVVSLADRKLALMVNGEVQKTYTVAVGKRSTPSPTGEFHIVTRLAAPTYYHPGTVVPPGPANPLGTRWIGLSQKGYGIHGTNEPRSVGKAASHGCIRMKRGDLEQLFALVHAGDAVEIHGERDAQPAEIFGASVAPVAVAGSQASAAVEGGDGLF